MEKGYMQAHMLEQNLLLSSIVKHMESVYPDRKIISIDHDGSKRTFTYDKVAIRIRKLANALIRLGIKKNDRIATFGFNSHQHFELYYAISGIGAICHTINVRLSDEDTEYIINDAEGRIVFVDSPLVKKISSLKNKCKSLEHIVVFNEENFSEDIPDDFIKYEELILDESETFEWPVFDEKTPSGLCYTSGTTGRPKGVIYNHRSSILHAWAFLSPNVLSLALADTVLSIVPLFHVNGWGLPYTAPMVGANLVLPGSKLDGKSLTNLINEEKITKSVGVPSIWNSVLEHMDLTKQTVKTLDRIIIGGAAAAPKMIEVFNNKYSVEVVHAWGMTEMSPVGTSNPPMLKTSGNILDNTKTNELTKQGRPLFGVELRIVDDNGVEIAWDGSSAGELQAKGSWVVSNYYKNNNDNNFSDGWFKTGDMATIDANGIMQIKDRVKDVIKSGGEWISSIELENSILEHSEISQAAVIGIPDVKWDERPLLLAIKTKGSSVTVADLKKFLNERVTKWWVPEKIIFVDQLPIGATGKILKKKIREDYSYNNSLSSNEYRVI